MSAAPASRALIRQSRLLLRRNNFRQASTTAEAAAKAQEAGSQAISKASEGLSKVQSSASSAVARVGSSLNSVGGRTGRMINWVSSLIPPTIYYSRVGLELGKIMFKGQQMYPPTIAQFQSYFQPLTNAIRNPQTIMSNASSLMSLSPDSALQSVRNVNSKQLATVGVILAEVLGFFTVGEMVGRMKIVGYHGEVHHEH